LGPDAAVELALELTQAVVRAAASQTTVAGAAPPVREEPRSLESYPIVAEVRQGSLTSLSGRELEVLRLVIQGMTNQQIGMSLRVSRHTVARHVSNVLGKLRVPSRAAATAVALRAGIT
jgi:DNA-binding NarL/FixJ family response regulator